MRNLLYVLCFFFLLFSCKEKDKSTGPGGLGQSSQSPGNPPGGDATGMQGHNDEKRGFLTVAAVYILIKPKPTPNNATEAESLEPTNETEIDPTKNWIYALATGPQKNGKDATYKFSYDDLGSVLPVVGTEIEGIDVHDETKYFAQGNLALFDNRIYVKLSWLKSVELLARGKIRFDNISLFCTYLVIEDKVKKLVRTANFIFNQLFSASAIHPSPTGSLVMVDAYENAESERGPDDAEIVAFFTQGMGAQLDYRLRGGTMSRNDPLKGLELTKKDKVVTWFVEKSQTKGSTQIYDSVLTVTSEATVQVPNPACSSGNAYTCFMSGIPPFLTVPYPSELLPIVGELVRVFRGQCVLGSDTAALMGMIYDFDDPMIISTMPTGTSTTTSPTGTSTTTMPTGTSTTTSPTGTSTTTSPTGTSTTTSP